MFGNPSNTTYVLYGAREESMLHCVALGKSQCCICYGSVSSVGLSSGALLKC